MSADREQARRVSEESRKRFGLLLVSIVAAFAVQGIASPSAIEQMVVSVLLATTLLLALWVAEVRRSVMVPVAAIAVLLVLVSVVDAVAGESNGVADRIANLLLVVLAPPAIVIGVVRTLRRRNQVTLESVFGVLCLYLLLGMAFALIYGIIARVDGTFFAQDVPATVSRCLYFSFVTLTTVGYGDYTAASNLGHTLAVFEALIGQIYLVTVVSLIVGNLGRRRAGNASEPVQVEQP